MGHFFSHNRNCDEKTYKIAPSEANILEAKIRELSLAINKICSRLDKLEDITSVTFKVFKQNIPNIPTSGDSTPNLTPVKHKNPNAFFMRGGCH